MRELSLKRRVEHNASFMSLPRAVPLKKKYSSNESSRTSETASVIASARGEKSLSYDVASKAGSLNPTLKGKKIDTGFGSLMTRFEQGKETHLGPGCYYLPEGMRFPTMNAYQLSPAFMSKEREYDPIDNPRDIPGPGKYNLANAGAELMRKQRK